jgi:hypothetical protein
MARGVTIWRQLRLEHKGRTVVGSYAFNSADRTIDVRSPLGHKSAPLAGFAPETLANVLLREMADEGNA